MPLKWSELLKIKPNELSPRSHGGLIALTMEAVSTSEKTVNIYQITPDYNISEDSQSPSNQLSSHGSKEQLSWLIYFRLRRINTSA
jgi:hypothetical protein